MDVAESRVGATAFDVPIASSFAVAGSMAHLVAFTRHPSPALPSATTSDPLGFG